MSFRTITLIETRYHSSSHLAQLYSKRLSGPKCKMKEVSEELNNATDKCSYDSYFM